MKKSLAAARTVQATTQQAEVTARLERKLDLVMKTLGVEFTEPADADEPEAIAQAEMTEDDEKSPEGHARRSARRK